MKPKPLSTDILDNEAIILLKQANSINYPEYINIFKWRVKLIISFKIHLPEKKEKCRAGKILHNQWFYSKNSQISTNMSYPLIQLKYFMGNHHL